MQDTELFLSLAEIAGVFVGFGALIAVRSGGRMEAADLSGLRWVVSSAIWVVIVALTPILVSGYGVAGHDLWLVCSPIALVLIAVMIVVNGWAPEMVEERAITLASASRKQIVVVMGSTFWLPTVALAIALLLVLLGLLPDKEKALYLTAVGLGLFMSALHLFVMVFVQPRSPESRGG